MMAMLFRKKSNSEPRIQLPTVTNLLIIYAVYLIAFPYFVAHGEAGIMSDDFRFSSDEHSMHCSAVPKRLHRSVTQADKGLFVGSRVHDFITQLHSPPYPDSYAVVPPEYANMVGAGKRAVPFLLSLLSSKEEINSEAAIVALAEITNKSFAAYPADFVPHRDPVKWRKIVSRYHDWWREHQNESQTDWLVKDLRDADLRARRLAAMRLGIVGDMSAIPALHTALEDQTIRLDAALSLAQLGNKAAIPVLINEFLSDDAPLRHTGICLLLQLTGQTMGFDPEDDQSTRVAAIQRWKNWWEQHGPKYQTKH